MRTVLHRYTIFATLAVASLVTISTAHAARGFGVEVWTDRGNDGIYKPGDRMEVRARVSDDAHLLVYEIDSEGYVRVLFPENGGGGYVEGRQTLRVPGERSDMELVVQQPVGEGYIVAVASLGPFDDLPWYLRPYDARAEDIGYEGAANDDEGITSEGRIVGDPFVAMERIRRRLVRDYDDLESFSTSYASYYVHHRVRYPRYVCYDCHRPGHWNWWAGFDPYYASCSVFSVRANWGWYWGPSYWCGFVPYYVYTYRPDCPPRFRPTTGITYSAWNGWRKWNALWGGHLKRNQSEPPKDWSSPSKYRADRGWRNDQGKLPPGFLVADQGPGVRATRQLPTGRMQDPRDRGRLLDPNGRGVERTPVDRGGRQDPSPVRRDRDDTDVRDSRTGRGRLEEAPRGERAAPSRPGYERPAPRQERPSREEPRREESRREIERPRGERPAPVERSARREREREPEPKQEKVKEEKAKDAPREEKAKPERGSSRDSNGNGRRRG